MGDSKTERRNLFEDIPTAPPDPVFVVRDAYLADSSPQKVNLGVGAYRTDEGKPFVLPVVSAVESMIAADKTLNHEYLPIEGLHDLSMAANRLALGKENPAIIENRVCGVQSLSGTGAIRLAMEFLKIFHSSSPVYVSKPTWGTHLKIARNSGFADVREYRYHNPVTNGLDFEGMMEDLRNAPDKSIVLLQTCAHNPTGIDLTKEQWKPLADLFEEKKHIPLFDLAYQGFVSGDPDQDAWAARYFVERGFELMICQSFAKIFGLYNERVGNLCCVCKTSEAAMNVLSQIKIIVRPMYSNPPNHGARVVATILNNPPLQAEWRDQLRGMADRILTIRRNLYEKLKGLGTPGDWSRIINQRGMFTFTGLTPKQVETLTQKYHIYLMKNGRINMCGINSSNIDYVSNAIDEVVRSSSDAAGPRL